MLALVLALSACTSGDPSNTRTPAASSTTPASLTPSSSGAPEDEGVSEAGVVDEAAGVRVLDGSPDVQADSASTRASISGNSLADLMFMFLYPFCGRVELTPPIVSFRAAAVNRKSVREAGRSPRGRKAVRAFLFTILSFFFLLNMVY